MPKGFSPGYNLPPYPEDVIIPSYRTHTHTRPPIGASRNPERRPSHLIADCMKRYTGDALDNQFIMDATHYEAVLKRIHDIGDVPRYCLDDVFHKLGTVGFDAAPLPGCLLSFLVSAGRAAAQLLCDQGDWGRCHQQAKMPISVVTEIGIFA